MNPSTVTVEDLFAIFLRCLVHPKVLPSFRDTVTEILRTITNREAKDGLTKKPVEAGETFLHLPVVDSQHPIAICDNFAVSKTAVAL